MTGTVSYMLALVLIILDSQRTRQMLLSAFHTCTMSNMSLHKRWQHPPSSLDQVSAYTLNTVNTQKLQATHTQELWFENTTQGVSLLEQELFLASKQVHTCITYIHFYIHTTACHTIQVSYTRPAHYHVGMGTLIV